MLFRSINMGVQISLRSCFQFCWIYIEIAGSYGNFSFNFLRNLRIVFHTDYTILHSQGTRVPTSSHAHQTFVLFCVFDNGHPSGYELISHCGFDLHFLMISDVEHLLMFAGHLCIFFGEMSAKVLCPFLNWVILLLSCRNSLYILGINPLSDI